MSQHYRDIIGLDTSLDKYHRATKHSVGYEPFRVYFGKLRWTPLRSDSMAVFCGSDIKSRNDFLAQFVLQSGKQAHSVRVRIIDFSKDLRELCEELKKSSVGTLGYVESKVDLGTVLKNIAVFRDDIKQEARALRVIEQPGIKLTFFLLNMRNEDVASLHTNNELNLLFKDLVKNSTRERIHIVPILPSARSLPKDLVQLFDWAVFMGDENVKTCTDIIYSDMTESMRSIKQSPIGIAYSNERPELVTIYPYKYTRSEWQIKRDQYEKDESKAFEAFLDALDDGSIEHD